MTRVVVTGAAGFVGGALVGALRAVGVPVRSVARAEGDDYAALAAEPGDVLVHLAGPSATESDAAEPEALALLEPLLSGAWSGFVFASSAAVLGAPSVYARAKRACEERVLARGGTVARLANVYGLGANPRSVIPGILRQLGGAGPLEVTDPSAVRDFVFVDDVVAGLTLAARMTPGGVIHLGTGIGTSIGELARLALDLSGETRRSVRSLSANPAHSRLVLGVSETERRLGWRAKTSLRNGLASLIGARP